MISNTRKLFEHILENAGIKFETHVSLSVPKTVRGDKVRLNQVLNNLVSNAIKFTEKGSISVHVRLLEETTEYMKLKFNVKDTGIGIQPDKMDRLFKLFSQGDSSMTRKYGGTGLGLAITKNLCEIMGGEIGVESQPGQGSDFHFSVLLKHAEDSEELPEVQEEKESDKIVFPDIKILLAEDNTVNQKVVSYHFSKLGCKFDIANNGAEAVQKFMDQFYDIILMDISMPVMDGLEATRKIREFEKQTQTSSRSRIIAVTANATREAKEEYINNGMDGYISKPFKFEDILRCVSQYSSTR